MQTENPQTELKPNGKYENIQLNDNFNAKFFGAYYGNTVLWCRELGGWLLFNGSYWEYDKNDKIGQYALNIIDIMSRDFETNGYKFRRWTKRLGNTHAWRSMLECAKVYMGKSHDKFDCNENLFNCINGTISLDANNIFILPIAEHYITKRGNVEYEQLKECPRWHKFLDEIFLEDKEIIDFMQRVCGYCMTSSTREQCMFILYGKGNNGKSKFIETIAHILGDYAKNCPSSTFIQKQNPGIPNDIARLKSARLVTAQETNQNITLDEELIKQLTGNKIITARFLNKEFFDFEPTFKIFLSTNHKPNIRGTDEGIWRRIHMIPFNMKIEKDKIDINLGDILLKESSGILNWMINGYLEYKNIGLKVPEKIKESTQIYREEEDDIGQFIKDECIIERGGFIPTMEFKNRFKSIMGYHKGGKAISEYMARHGFKPHGDKKISINGTQQRGYVNIKWDNHLEVNKHEVEYD